MTRHATIAFRWTALLLVGLAPPLSAEPLKPLTKTFEGWTATCNNLRDCVVLATAQDDLFYVRIARSAGATAPAGVKLVLAGQDEIKAPAPAFRLVAKGDGPPKPLGPFAAPRSADDPATARAQLGEGDASLAFIEAIRNAKTLDYDVAGDKGTLDLKGLSAALRFIDAEQGRAGTPTALVARGMTPIGQMPPPPVPPKVDVADAAGVVAIEKPVVSEALVKLASAICDPDVVKAHEGTEAWRLAAGKVLVAVPCSQGAYNQSSALYFTDEAGGSPMAVHLPQALTISDEPSPENVATNVGFDPAKLELSALDKGRGLSDCGSAETWVWTGTGFALLEASSLDACPGTLPEDWPNVFKATR